MARVSFELDNAPIRRRLEDLSPRIHEFIDGSMEFGALKGVEDMKLHAPWTDRTGNARSGLFTAPSSGLQRNHWEILFSHSMPYGIWLEIRNNGKYAIIMPAVKRTGEDLMRHLKDLFEELDKMR